MPKIFPLVKLGEPRDTYINMTTIHIEEGNSDIYETKIQIILVIPMFLIINYKFYKVI